MQAFKDEEWELLQELKRMKGVEGRQPTAYTGDQFVESRGIRYSMTCGGRGKPSRGNDSCLSGQ